MPAERRSSPSARRVLFGPFDLNVTERSLKKGDEIIPLGARAFDILIALIDRAGEKLLWWPRFAVGWTESRLQSSSLPGGPFSSA
jgi:hypothetical protein